MDCRTGLCGKVGEMGEIHSRTMSDCTDDEKEKKKKSQSDSHESI